ncbi:unnamed protein product [Orchesella dallaii]|uniref:Uncharacterized protein n=1 Tax=Orchesella dallaii TaxID=48710 RepID=A0ABP1RH92_9HEXA
MVTIPVNVIREERNSLWSIEDKYGFCLFLVSATICPFTILIVAATVFFNTDVAYFLCEYILPHPMFRTTSETLYALLIRLAFTMIWVLEMARTATFVLSVLNITLDVSSKLIQDLIVISTLNSRKFYLLYVHFTLLYKKLEHTWNEMLHAMVFIMFWTFVTCVWVIVTGYGKVQPHIFWCSILIGIFLLIAHAMMFPTMVETLGQLDTLVLNHQLKEQQFISVIGLTLKAEPLSNQQAHQSRDKQPNVCEKYCESSK